MEVIMESVELNVQKAKQLVAQAERQSGSPGSKPFKRELVSAALLPVSKSSRSKDKTPPPPIKTNFSASKSSASHNLSCSFKESSYAESPKRKSYTSDPNKKFIVHSMVTYLFSAYQRKVQHFLTICKQNLHEENIQTSFADKLATMHLYKKSLLGLKLNAKYCRQRRKTGARILLRVAQGLLADGTRSDLKFALDQIQKKQLRIADIISERLDEEDDSKTREQPPISPEPLEKKAETLAKAAPRDATAQQTKTTKSAKKPNLTIDTKEDNEKKKSHSPLQSSSSRRAQPQPLSTILSKSPIKPAVAPVAAIKPNAYQSTASLSKTSRADTLRTSTDDASYLKKKAASKWTSSTSTAAKIHFTPRDRLPASEKSPVASKASSAKKAPSTPKARQSPLPAPQPAREPVVHTSILELENESGRLSQSSSTAQVAGKEAALSKTEHSRTPTADGPPEDADPVSEGDRQVLERYLELKRKARLG